MDGSLYVIIGGDKKVKVGRTIYYYLVIGGQGNTRAFAGGEMPLCHFWFCAKCSDNLTLLFYVIKEDCIYPN